MSESAVSLVQGIAAGFVTFHHTQHLNILREEAGRQQAVDAQLQTLLQREGHPLQGGWESHRYTTPRFGHSLCYDLCYAEIFFIAYFCILNSKRKTR